MWTKSRGVESAALFLSSRVCFLLILAIVFGVTAQGCAGQTIMASKRDHNFYVSLMSQSGKSAWKDEYCVVFSRTSGGEPAEVGDVLVDFAQQVGRIRESPQEFAFSPDGRGRYCGSVDLGQQYYQPASYYVMVHYTDTSGKRRTCRFFLTIKQEKYGHALVRWMRPGNWDLSCQISGGREQVGLPIAPWSAQGEKGESPMGMPFGALARAALDYGS
jgi:hypothetical protein